MSVKQSIKKFGENYIEKFRKDPEAMAYSYAWLAAGYVFCYAGLILAVRELDKKEAQLAEITLLIEKHNAYLDGWNDSYRATHREK